MLKRIAILVSILSFVFIKLSEAQTALTEHPIQSHNTQFPWITVSILMVLFLYWLAYINNPIFLNNKLQLIMHSKDRGSFYSATMRSQITSYTLFLVGYIISFALYIYHAASFLSHAQSFKFFALVLGGILGYHLIKFLIYTSVIKFLFIPKGYHALVTQSYMFMNIVLGIFLLPVNIALTYTNNDTAIQVTLLIGLLIVAAYAVTLSMKLFYIFFKDVLSLFYMILYLCTLEILPLWVPIQLGLNALIINE